MPRYDIYKVRTRLCLLLLSLIYVFMDVGIYCVYINIVCMNEWLGDMVVENIQGLL